MASTINVSGPTRVMVNTGGGYVELGFCDNDNLPSVTFTDHVHEIKTSASGNAPEEMVVQGVTATITVTLVKWDASVWASLIAAQRGAAYNATVGKMLYDSGSTFGVQLDPTIAGRPGYTFSTCYLMNDTGDANFGNVERRLTITFRATQNPQTLVLCTYS